MLLSTINMFTPHQSYPSSTGTHHPSEGLTLHSSPFPSPQHLSRQISTPRSIVDSYLTRLRSESTFPDSTLCSPSIAPLSGALTPISPSAPFRWGQWRRY